MWYRFVAASSLLLVLLGCDPVFRTSVRVRSAPASKQAQEPSEGALEGAVVSMHCGTRSSFAATETDAEGVAVLDGIGAPEPKECWLVIAKPGYELRRVDWADTCTYRVCEEPVEVELTRERPAK